MDGAFFLEGPGNNQWIVPCMSSANLTFTFGGRKFPIHPLDLTQVKTITADNGTSFTFCVGQFNPFELDSETVQYASWEMILGDSFLRNVFASFNYGDISAQGNVTSSSDPFVQLLSVTDANEAIVDFQKSRKQTLQRLPSEPSYDQLLGLLNTNADTVITIDPDQNDPLDGDNPSDRGNTLAAAALSSDSSPSDDDLSTLADHVELYSPIIVGLLAGNLLVGLVLCAVGLSVCVRRGHTEGGRVHSVDPNYAPVRFQEVPSRGGDESFGHPKYNDSLND